MDVEDDLASTSEDSRDSPPKAAVPVTPTTPEIKPEKKDASTSPMCSPMKLKKRINAPRQGNNEETSEEKTDSSPDKAKEDRSEERLRREQEKEAKVIGECRLSGCQIAACVAVVLYAKALLADGYHSTDMEVHRNWMAITHHLPLREWYRDETSQWTLDYPPFFAYLEKAFATLAAATGTTDILALQPEPLATTNVVYFMRASVLVTDVVYIMASCLVPTTARSIRGNTATFLFFITHTSLILLDNIHFQYNNFMTGLVLLSLFFMGKGWWLMAALAYTTLLNFKHIYVYYAPGYVVAYLIHYFSTTPNTREGLEGRHPKWRPNGEILGRGIRLATPLILPFVLSFGPFVLVDGLEGVKAILVRLFPVQRGLTHAYWAPNAWALYNTADLVANKILSRLGFSLDAPGYTLGLVQEYSHTVLPTIGPISTLLATLAGLAPLIAPIANPTNDMGKIRPCATPAFLLTLSSIAFVFFGYHVHEKALILPLFPLAFATIQYAVFCPLLLDLGLLTASALGPLLFTTTELPLRQAFFIFQFVPFLATVGFCRVLHHLPYSTLLSPFRLSVVVGLLSLDVYDCYIHKFLFPTTFPFLPLMLLSIANALLMLCVYVRSVALAWPYIGVEMAKRRCLRKEAHYKHDYPLNDAVRSVDEIKVVAAVDMSVSPFDPTLAVVGAVFVDVEKGETLHEVTTVVIYDQEYIPGFLALSEERHMAEIILETIDAHPELRPQVILVDGNGVFHRREFGLACHVAASTGIPTIGCAKNIDWSLVGGERRKEFENKVKKIIADTPRVLGSAPFDIIQPVRASLITLRNSAQRLFVSAGLGIDLRTATAIVLKVLAMGMHPVKQADTAVRLRAGALI